MSEGKPLVGVRVLDMTRVVSGPLCGRLLADLGAEVVKLEPPDGDTTRAVPPYVGGVSPYYAQMNAGKRNVCVDLKAPGAPEAVARMAAKCDVFLENFRPGVLARFGLDADSLLAANPALVYCSITGWGQDGPWADRRSYAPLVHADVGTMELAARRRGRRPEQEINQHADVHSATLATSAVLAALLQRVATGTGQRLDMALGQSAFYANEWAAVELQPPADEFGRFDTWNHFTYRLGDGSYVALIGDPVELFPAWAKSLGAPEEVLADERFASAGARRAHVEELVAAIDELTSAFPDFAALDAVLDPWMLAAPVRSVADLAASEWASHRRLVAEAEPGLPVPAAPWASSGADVSTGGGVAGLGADNRAVLVELGFTDREVDALVDAGALRGGAQP
jgi:crotonobetainyl-CoA:carnitine CoA-transferase CaiB-like acyl-CoA transferase